MHPLFLKEGKSAVSGVSDPKKRNNVGMLFNVANVEVLPDPVLPISNW
jgi:hypothetical protein